GVNFINIRNVGDPVELGALYAEQGADELVYLDITASHEERKTFADLVRRIAQNLNIPFTVGGGISELKDAEILLSAGADKISINSSAVRNPNLVNGIAQNFGSQFCVVAIDAKLEGDNWIVYINGGRIPTNKRLYTWAKEVEERGAGEILFTSMNHDGTKDGFAYNALADLSDKLSIPVIASGGAGTMEHFAEVFTAGKADAGLAASIFHFREIAIPDLKKYLKDKGIEIRI
ncbi:MAG: imidazole glycerol phosphate synthase subunit HisF, partial [Bacteroidales bacterium]|nr:imidazole glycerol phosphate synthase subunit HisF [Bacteroidales bacterium]